MLEPFLTVDSAPRSGISAFTISCRQRSRLILVRRDSADVAVRSLPYDGGYHRGYCEVGRGAGAYPTRNRFSFKKLSLLTVAAMGAGRLINAIRPSVTMPDRQR